MHQVISRITHLALSFIKSRLTTHTIRQVSEEFKQPQDSRVLRSELYSSITSLDLYDLFHEISSHFSTWNNCDVILSCPLTLEGIKSLFSDKDVICIRDVRDAVPLLEGRRYLRIGIVSPWLMFDLLRDRNSLFLLFRSCREKLTYLDNGTLQTENMDARKLLHVIGFYEVAQLVEDRGTDFVSIGLTPNGSYSLFGSQPALPTNDGIWITNCAYRTACSEISGLEWENLAWLPFESRSTGVTAPAFGYSLAAIRQLGNSPDEESSIEASIAWQSGAAGFASLVVAYSGPGDCNMYACTLQVDSNNTPATTLFLSDRTWQPISETYEIPRQNVTLNGELHTVTLRLCVNRKRILVSVDDLTLIDVLNTQLVRAPRVGIRAHGNHFSFSKIITSRDVPN